MYSTCLFCNAALGANEVIEHFPVGRRLAYDAATGRLWVVCAKCERWNLSPLETRWEAIEEAERAFRGTKMRVQTDNIGLAQLSEGLELVRVGKPLQLEFAAWRYGDQFGKRRRKYLAMGTVAGVGSILPMVSVWGNLLTGAHSVAIGEVTLGVAALGFGAQTTDFFSRWKRLVIPIASVRDDHDNLLRVTLSNARCAVLKPTEDAKGWRLGLPNVEVVESGWLARKIGGPQKKAKLNTPALLNGDAARRALATLLPHLNHGGAGRKGIREAVDVVNAAPSIDHMLLGASHSTEEHGKYFKLKKGESNVWVLPSRIRLALEMSLHSDDERRAMEGELQELEQRWRDADAIAKISDSLLLPENIDSRVSALHSRNTLDGKVQERDT